jgi:hypothetical protein
MLKDRRAGGFEEVSKPSLGIHTKKEEAEENNKRVCGSTCQIPSFTTHPRHI